ncbi:tetratricopeptide repeat protein [Acidovorax sp. 106]|uniref:tetratricopeptide repeat protein n=1 Tax=Acidovorax sp. 106 TaxID=2135637 RepID=UPI000EB50B4A|nr:tetratricopeptide repeat protein [Acidovorax sp. 106]RLJ38666.1 tetratricopeptide repeat protein [Acidovorax sp. 106]
MATSRKATYLFAIALVLAVLGIYLPGIRNDLLFDDLRLSDGTIFGEYGSLLQFKQRMLSYGSFVWLQSLFGEGWWKQRFLNIALHLGTVACIYALLKALLTQAKFPQEFEDQPHFEASRTAALQVGVALFALNPVAVYAVGYLVQRSIVMATLFAVLACWLFVRGLQTGRAGWYAGALGSYVLAVLSKEYAVMTAAMAMPLYIYIRRPGWRAIAIVAGGTLLVLALAAAAFFGIYGAVLGKVFDPRSAALVQQLEAMRPGITAQIYPLSLLNEAALFFAYGLLWFVPNVQWMSVDLRPAFPLGFASWGHLAGTLGYVCLLGVAIWMVVRRKDALGLAGLILLFPLLWFATEFATVWVQDPFVLYRSYLWAVAVPGLVAIVLTGFKPKTIYAVGVLIALIFGGLALERNLSLRDEGTAWADAAEKIDTKAPANAVGRSRPFLNLGAYHLEKGSLALAERAFLTADALGDLGGNARFNIGVTLQQQKKHAEALQAFAAAQAKGFSGQSLHYHRGESAFALGQFPLAFESFGAALKDATQGNNTDKKMQVLLLQRHADAGIAAQQYDAAISDFETLLQMSPKHPRLLLGMGMAMVGKGDTQKAVPLFDDLIASAPSAPAYYGRGVAFYRAGKLNDGLKDLDEAIKLEPRNAQYRQVREQLTSAIKPAGKSKP